MTLFKHFGYHRKPIFSISMEVKNPILPNFTITGGFTGTQTILLKVACDVQIVTHIYIAMDLPAHNE
jgi:hypothetical protein